MPRMTPELTLLAWSLVLAIAQILLPAHLRTQETGIAYNTGARDAEGPPMRPVTGRLRRAQANLFETLPLFAAAVLIAHLAGRDGALTLAGCWIFLVARVAYLPLYAFGVPYLRSLAWLAGLLGLVLVLAAVLRPA